MLNAIKDLKKQKDAELASLKAEKDTEIAALKVEYAERMARMESKIEMLVRAMAASDVADATAVVK